MPSESPSRRQQLWPQAGLGALIATLAGLALWHGPEDGSSLDAVSYDLPSVYAPRPEPPEAIIVRMDEQAHHALDQREGHWSRALHAELVDTLKQAHAKLVVFDIYFSDPGPEADDHRLSAAIKASGNVVLASHSEETDSPGFKRSTFLPRTEFVEGAQAVGLDNQFDTGDKAFLGSRKIYPGVPDTPSLAWVAAEKAGAPVPSDAAERLKPRWFRHYGPPGSIPSVSYDEALRPSSQIFSNKCVFIGGHPNVRRQGAPSDAFETPFSRWRGAERSSGVELHATAFLNLLRAEWLTRLPPELELFYLLFFGISTGFCFAYLRPTSLFIVSASIGTIVFAGACLLYSQKGIWTSWMLVAGVQLPAATAWSLINRARHAELSLSCSPSREPSPHAAETRPHDRGSIGGAATSPEPMRPPAISDHTLLREVGRGGYGEVWLARNAIGLHRAVKIVRQSGFRQSSAYERAFRGIEKYMPISLSHPALLPLLHVAHNETDRFFYYIMEIADDAIAGQQFDAANYTPLTLAALVRKEAELPLPRCLQIAVALTEALGFLHQQKLVHRDIKPANIIFVNGTPKLADIDLVTDIAPEGKPCTCLGTFGYIPPEGPGTPVADIYSFGKVLYDLSFGRQKRTFPDIQTSLVMGNPESPLFQLNEIIIKSCENDPRDRYQSMAELRAALLTLPNS